MSTSPSSSLRPRGIIALLLAAAIPALAAPPPRAASNQPHAAVTNMRIARLDLARMTPAFALAVHNPNPVPLHISAVEYTLDVGTARVAQARHAAAFVARPRAAAAITVNVPVAFADLYDAVGGPRSAARCAYRFAAIVTCAADGRASVRLPAELRGTLPVIAAPVITLKSMRVDSLTREGANLIVTLNVSNPNAFEIAVNRLTYDLAMNNSPWARGAMPARVELPPQRASHVHVPVTLALATFRELPVLLARNEPSRYRLRGYVDAQTSLPELRTLTLPYDRSGVVNLRNLAAAPL